MKTEAQKRAEKKYRQGKGKKKYNEYQKKLQKKIRQQAAEFRKIKLGLTE